ncbi:glycosyltransferase family 4 protein [Gloeocapsopsis crepidinum LEGE 06123]|uniref:Glycosyltransferase family 4 protein n=1 Tax=Gloeocapsopsis crepidinum LEGE 06123 TaxID=588587 RepID=A0ABR9V0D2_9CHRO|nr:glycosyltransferase family 4 protein [Gloeocapsopsis crepidinum]MBE9193730.1 glycosyltransferase family 4 protein [Gloeocapsopsis crepidinum LEGE 06123]
MNSNAAIFYKRDGYDTSSNRLLGRQAAGEGFLKGWIEFSRADTLYCYATSRAEFVDFCQRIQPWMKQPRQVEWLPTSNPYSPVQPGTIYYPAPTIAQLAWQRHFTDQQAYSICGVTHTIASLSVMQSIGELLIAPMQPWDALICTSIAVKTAIQRLVDTWAEYLAQRIGSKPTIDVQLPIIPLGVDCNSFSPSNKIQIRHSVRQQLGIALDDIVILFVGRLCFYAKAHPVPMYLAIERAVQASNVRVHLIQAGWFEDQKEEAAFKESAKVFCPSVNTIFVDGRKPEVRSSIWFVADIFVSLVDNIQETFGLTPIEAMAAGLPVVVSDWDGYQESVRDEIDGFKIPTVIPPPTGIDLAFNYLSDNLNYSAYIAHTAMMAAVDVDACATALTKLITDSELRQRLGNNGRERARKLYDWQVAIAAYENLWQELAEIRTKSAISAPLTPDAPPYPLCDDPLRVFAHYPTATLNQDSVLGIGAMATPQQLNAIQQIWITNFGAEKRIAVATIDAIVTAIAQNGSLSVAQILSQFSEQNTAKLLRTLVYLLKFDILRLES